MSLLRNIKNTFRGFGKKAEKSLADPTRDYSLAIEDSEKNIKEAKDAISKVMATNMGIERKIANHKAEMEKYMRLAKVAKDKGDTENAKVFFTKYQSAQTAIGSSEQILANNKAIVEQKRSQIATWEDGLTKAKATKSSFALRQQMLETTNALNDLNMADENGNGIPDHLETAMDALQAEEDALAARESMNTDPALTAEQKYSNVQTDAEFEAFMNKS